MIVARLYANSVVIVRSFVPDVRDTERLALRFVMQWSRFRLDHLASIRSRQLQHSLPISAVLSCLGLEQSTVFAPATMPTQSEQGSPSFVLRFRLTNQPTSD